MRRGVQLIGLAAALSLVACMIPEKFSASLDFQPSGTYRFRFDGTSVNAMALAARQQGGLSAKDEQALKDEAVRASKLPGVKKVSYVGNGRYEVSVDQMVEPKGEKPLIDVVSVRKGADGIYSVSSKQLRPKDVSDLLALGVKVDGKLEVILPSDAKVLSHNASSTPGLFSKAYGWKIGSVGDQPSIRFKLGS